MRNKATVSAAFQLSDKLGTSRCSLQLQSHSNAHENPLPNMCHPREPLTVRCWRPWRRADRHGNSFWVQEYTFNSDRHMELAVCVGVCKFYVYAQATKGCISGPSSISALCYHSRKKINKRRTLLYAHNQQKR